VEQIDGGLQLGCAHHDPRIARREIDRDHGKRVDLIRHTLQREDDPNEHDAIRVAACDREIFGNADAAGWKIEFSPTDGRVRISDGH
jgi:predicted glycosyl hydrolase (DUF1957 family)